MAVPTFVQAGTGVAITAGSGTVSLAGCTAANFIVIFVLEDGTLDDISPGAVTNISDLWKSVV